MYKLFRKLLSYLAKCYQFVTIRIHIETTHLFKKFNYIPLCVMLVNFLFSLNSLPVLFPSICIPGGLKLRKLHFLGSLQVDFRLVSMCGKFSVVSIFLNNYEKGTIRSLVIII